MIGAAITYVFRFIPLLLSTLITLLSFIPANHERLEEDIVSQLEHISALEQAYENGEIAPIDESAFFAGDLYTELEAGIKFNEISFIGTHNSYQSATTETYQKLFNNLDYLTFGLVSEELSQFENESLTDQLNCGIHSFEMDVEVFDRDGEISFTCMHSPHLDMTTTCYDFSLGLKEIAMWSDNNPDHLPVTILVEPKNSFIPLEDMKALNMDYMTMFEEMLRETLGDKLFTPADMLRDYESFGEMRAADDWCKVSDMLGKVVILLHEGNVTEDYIDLDPTIRSQAMFPMLRYKDVDRDCASFILMNDPNEVLNHNNEVIHEKNIIVRTMSDSYASFSQEKIDTAFEGDAQIVSTDYPPKTDPDNDNHVVLFDGYATVRKVS